MYFPLVYLANCAAPSREAGPTGFTSHTWHVSLSNKSILPVVQLTSLSNNGMLFFGIEIVGLLGISLKYITELGWVKTLGPWASAALYIAKKTDSNSKDPVPTGDYTTYTITYNYEKDVNLYTRSNQHIPKRYRFTDTNKFYFTRTSLTWSYRFRKGEELY